MTTIEQTKTETKLLDGLRKVTPDLTPLSAALRQSHHKANSVDSESRYSHPALDGAARLRLQMLYFERLAHFVRSKMSVPSAVIRDQLAGAALDRRDFEDGAEAIKTIISTLESLDWGLSPEASQAARVPAAVALRQIAETKKRRGDAMHVATFPMELEGEAKHLLLRTDELQRVCKALCRYMQSYTTIRLEPFLSCCHLSLHSAPVNSGLVRDQFLLLSAAISPGLLRRTRLAPYAGRVFSLEQLIEADHSASSLLLFSPLATLSLDGLHASFEPSQTSLQFRLSATELKI